MIHLYHYTNEAVNESFYSELCTFYQKNFTRDDLLICDTATYSFFNLTLANKIRHNSHNVFDINNINFERLLGKRFNNVFLIDYSLVYNELIKNIIQRYCPYSEIFGVTYVHSELIKISKEIDFYKKEKCSKKEIELIMLLKDNFSKHIVNFLLKFDFKFEQISNFDIIKKHWKT